MFSKGIDETAGQSYSARPEHGPTQDRYDIAAAGDEKPRELSGTLRRTAVAFSIAVAAAVAQSRDAVSAWATTDISQPAQTSEQGSVLVRDGRALLASAITAYCGLEDGWDGEGGVAPSRQAVDDALSFIRLLPLRARLPKPMVSGDGEVGFYWKTADCYIDVGFFGDGTISYYGRAEREGLEARGTEAYSRRALPKDLLDVVNLA